MARHHDVRISIEPGLPSMKLFECLVSIHFVYNSSVMQSNHLIPTIPLRDN
jgi:hypothetical protein